MKPPPKLANRLRGRRNKLMGDYAEAVVGLRLHQLGYLCVQRIQTGWRVQRAGGRIIGASPMAKVSGDFRAVVKGGRSVLVEVKRRPTRLGLGCFAPHSCQALTDHAMAGGQSLVAWVSSQGVAIFEWMVFRGHLAGAKAKGISWDMAQTLAISVP